MTVLTVHRIEANFGNAPCSPDMILCNLAVGDATEFSARGHAWVDSLARLNFGHNHSARHAPNAGNAQICEQHELAPWTHMRCCT